MSSLYCSIGVLLMLVMTSAIAEDCPALLNHQFKTLQGTNVNLCDYLSLIHI